MVNTLNRTVCWNWNNTNVVNFTEFFFLSLTCTCHTRQFLVHTEKVLVSDRGRCLRFILNWHTFFSFNSLVQSIRITTTFHSTTCKLVDNQDFLLFAHHIVNIEKHDVVGTKGVINKVSKSYVFDVIEVFKFEVAFSLVNP